MVRGYKGAVTRQAALISIDGPVWQRNYHDHIIRNDESYARIATYINNNVANWKIAFSPEMH